MPPAATPVIESSITREDAEWTSCPVCSALPGDPCTAKSSFDTEIHGSTKTGIHAKRFTACE